MIYAWRLRIPSRALYFVVAIWLILLDPARAKVRPRATTIPAPLSIPPSQDWDGNDGPWSSFTLQVGTPVQAVKVFVSTAGSQTWVIAQEGCQPGEPVACGKERGGLYNYTASTTWSSNLANASSNIYTLDLDASLGYDGNGRYGFDDITLGFQGGGGPSLKNQTIAGVATKSFFLGLFGLAAKPSTFLSPKNPIPSFMQNLKNQSKIPSISWGYTAGNQYRLNEVLGSLTLGGYDKSKFTPSNTTFPFSTVDRGELSVQLQSISVGSVSLLPSPVPAYLDSSIPYLYLPVDACNLFETAFGLTWNDTAQLYFISETQRTLLHAQDPSVIFSLGEAGPNQVNISLPYSAFDLTASWPLVVNATRYFPLRRANDSSQYTLGRVFFQEAYMIADYERGNFSISQCKWDSAPQSLISILSPDAGTSSTHGLSTGVIAGIAAGGVVLVLAGALLFFLFWWRPRHSTRKASELAANAANITTAGSHQTANVYNKPELDSNEVPKPQIAVYEADGRKIAAPVEIGDNDQIHEMSGEDGVRELPASPITTPKPRFSWMGSERGSLLRRSATPGTETMSSISSGWGSTNRAPNENVSPATPEEQREQLSRRYSPGGL